MCVCVCVYVACVGECLHVYVCVCIFVCVCACVACVLHVRMCVSVWRARERTCAICALHGQLLSRIDNRGELISKYRPTDTNLAQRSV